MLSISDGPDPVCAHKVRWNVGDAVIWMLAAILVSVVIGAGYLSVRYGGEVPPERSAVDLLVLQSGLWLVHLAGPWSSSVRKGAGVVADFGLKLIGRHVPVGILIGVVTQLGIVWALYQAIGLFVEGDAGEEARKLVAPMDGAFDWALLLFVVVIMAPLTEEFFYRGILLRSLQRSLGALPALLASAVIFAAVHMQPYQFPGLLVVGLIAGGMALKTGSLTMPFAFHLGFNGTAAIQLLMLAS